jgi:hypothetical protein
MSVLMSYNLLDMQDHSIHVAIEIERAGIDSARVYTSGAVVL